jgi:hypothetical protein
LVCRWLNSRRRRLKQLMHTAQMHAHTHTVDLVQSKRRHHLLIAPVIIWNIFYVFWIDAKSVVWPEILCGKFSKSNQNAHSAMILTRSANVQTHLWMKKCGEKNGDLFRERKKEEVRYFCSPSKIYIKTLQ